MPSVEWRPWMQENKYDLNETGWVQKSWEKPKTVFLKQAGFHGSIPAQSQFQPWLHPHTSAFQPSFAHLFHDSDEKYPLSGDLFCNQDPAWGQSESLRYNFSVGYLNCHVHGMGTHMLIDFQCSPNRREGLGAEGRGVLWTERKTWWKRRKDVKETFVSDQLGATLGVTLTLHKTFTAVTEAFSQQVAPVSWQVPRLTPYTQRSRAVRRVSVNSLTWGFL